MHSPIVHLSPEISTHMTLDASKSGVIISSDILRVGAPARERPTRRAGHLPLVVDIAGPGAPRALRPRKITRTAVFQGTPAPVSASPGHETDAAAVAVAATAAIATATALRPRGEMQPALAAGQAPHMPLPWRGEQRRMLGESKTREAGLRAMCRTFTSMGGRLDLVALTS